MEPLEEGKMMSNFVRLRHTIGHFMWYNAVERGKTMIHFSGGKFAEQE